MVSSGIEGCLPLLDFAFGFKPSKPSALSLVLAYREKYSKIEERLGDISL